MKTVYFGDVVAVNPRAPAHLRAGPPEQVTFLRMASVSEEGRIETIETKTYDEAKKGFTYFEEGDVLLAKITPCFENGKAAVAHDLPYRVGFGSTEFHVLRPSTAIDVRYLFYLVWNTEFRRDGVKRMAGAAGQKRLPADYLATLKIPLPPLDEQKRIAAVLDKADALRRQRQESLKLTEKLLQSVFLDMFVKSPDAAGWETRSVEWMAKDNKGSIRTGPFGSQLLHSEFVDHGVAVLGIDNAVKNRFEWGQPRFITRKKYASLRRYKVFPGDLIITIMGTLGRCAIVPEEIPESINTKHLCCITLDHKKCLPEFLHAAFLNHPDVLRQLGVRTKGAVMPGLNMGIIKDLTLPTPPVELQETFSEFVRAITKTRTNFENSQIGADDLFSSLQQRAFRGELELSRLVLDAEADTPPDRAPAKPITKPSRPKRAASFIEVPATVAATLKPLDGAVRKGAPIPWSADYFTYRILATQRAPFSFADLMKKAETIFEELPPYETIRDLIYDLLGQNGKPALIRQRFDLREVKETNKDGKEIISFKGRKEIVFEPVS